MSEAGWVVAMVSALAFGLCAFLERKGRPWLARALAAIPALALLALLLLAAVSALVPHEGMSLDAVYYGFLAVTFALSPAVAAWAGVGIGRLWRARVEPSGPSR